MSDQNETEIHICLFCAAPATGFCDAIIGLVDAGMHKPLKGPPYRVTTIEAMLEVDHTCNAPFCAAHGRVVGFVCGDEPDTIDSCIGCYLNKRGSGTGLLSAGAIAALRKQRHAEYRRMRNLPNLPNRKSSHD